MSQALNETAVINPFSSDFVFNSFSRITKRRPVYTGLVYFLLSFCVTYLLGAITGQLWGKNGLPPMYTTILDNINIGIIAPIGAGLLCHLYNTISSSFSLLIMENTVAPQDHGAYVEFLRKMEKLYNSKVALVVTLAISVVINSYNYVNKTDSWLGVNGGITGLYGRLFVVINFFVIGYILYKSIITVYAMRKLFQFQIDVQPLHPDRSGGLMAIGRLAIAVNYFVGLIVLFFTLLLTLDPFTGASSLYTAVIISFYVISPFLLLSSLSKANKVMSSKKRLTLEKLGRTFDRHFALINKPSHGNIFDLSNADEIIKVNKLYNIVESMPVWPFDVRSLTRLISTLLIPLIPLLLDFLGKSVF